MFHKVLIFGDRKFFPHAPAVKKEEGTKDDSATTTKTETASASDENKKPASLETALPAVPEAEPVDEKSLPEPPKEAPTTSESVKQEPETKKLKSSHEAAQDTDDEWEKIDQASVPRHATVEDVEDEEPKKF